MDKADFAAIKAQLKEKKITYQDIANWTRASRSWVGQVLNGHYPYYYAGEKGTAILPRYLERFFDNWQITWPSKERE